MRYFQDTILLIIAMLFMLLYLSLEARGQTREPPRQPRYELYDNRGRSQGYVRESPYSGRCCNVYNNDGSQRGVVRPRQERR